MLPPMRLLIAGYRMPAKQPDAPAPGTYAHDDFEARLSHASPTLTKCMKNHGGDDIVETTYIASRK